MALSSRALTTVAVTAVFTVIGTFFVALRLWTRFFISRAPGYEDSVLVCSWLCALATTACTFLQVNYGLGTHGASLQPAEVQNLLLCIYINISTYCTSIGLTKLAILLQYRRVFPTRRFQIWCWSFIAIIIAYTIATVVACIFVCTPVRRYWKPTTEGTCIDMQASWFSNAAINIVTDFMIIILPMPMVRRLNLPRRQKWLLRGVFAFGAVVCVISGIRLHSLLIITTSTDPTYDNTGVGTFSIVELYVALISACLPTLRPLLAQWISGLGSTRRASGNLDRNREVKMRVWKPSTMFRSFGGESTLLDSVATRGVDGHKSDTENGDVGLRVVTSADGVPVPDKEGSKLSKRGGGVVEENFGVIPICRDDVV